MALHHRVKRMEATLASRPCPLCVGPSVVRIIPAPVVARVSEVPWASDEPGDLCRCGRRVVIRVPPPVLSRLQ